MRVEILPDAAAAAARTAEVIAQLAAEALAGRARFTMALSGGTGPWQAFRLLAGEVLPWSRIHVLQVDERVAPDGHPDRNLTHLRRSFQNAAAGVTLHPMPVQEADLREAAGHYEDTLRGLAGSPPRLDLVHLGLGEDGHTASLVPGDPVLDVTDAEVAVTGVYGGRRRMTLTFPALNRARHIVWLVSGESKSRALGRLLRGHSRDPAGRVSEEQAILIADRAAATLRP